MPNYRLRNKWELLQLAERKQIKATGSGIAIAAGLPRSTITEMMRGRIPSNPTMAALVRLFDVPLDELFEIVAEDEDDRVPVPAA